VRRLGVVGFGTQLSGIEPPTSALDVRRTTTALQLPLVSIKGAKNTIQLNRSALFLFLFLGTGLGRRITASHLEC
jgi:hypothetical protein